MQSHPHRKPELLLSCSRRFERSRRRWKRDEERVALGVDLDPVLALERLTQDGPVFGKRGCVTVRAELVQQPRRSLDVGEEERDRAAGQFAHGASL